MSSTNSNFYSLAMAGLVFVAIIAAAVKYRQTHHRSPTAIHQQQGDKAGAANAEKSADKGGKGAERSPFDNYMGVKKKIDPNVQAEANFNKLANAQGKQPAAGVANANQPVVKMRGQTAGTGPAAGGGAASISRAMNQSNRNSGSPSRHTGAALPKGR